ncbi:hypothetical protein MSAN_01513800 [Mycena sanguinolenta]|uniref:Protein kinase domain-containing protein n=1 Tax=Mycena sanguinolenta TaxID=230812 RepID=A0A8H7CWM9_9AGAR|nr:hypothetical protein MSAN_01513800 [Mycena sanguinolenta]
MDPQVDSDEEFIVLSTSDCTESASAPFPQAAGLKSSAELFAKSIGLLPSLLGARVTEFQASGTTRTYTRKYSETMGRQIVDQRSVTNYTYIINGARNPQDIHRFINLPRRERRVWGEGGDQGGDGGAGQGPTVYFGQPEAQEPSEFRTIRLGDINLIKEFKQIRSSPQWSVVGRQIPRANVRRVYTAKLEGRESGDMTVATYEGDGAEEEWNQDLEKYKAVRHPNIMQLYGVVSTRRLRGMVFHDELIPCAQFLRRFEHSPILRAYIIAYCSIIKAMELWEAAKYMSDVFQKPEIQYSTYLAWIRSSTGELCLDLVRAEMKFELPWWESHVLRLENFTLDAPDSEDIIVSSLREDQYYNICSVYPFSQIERFQIPTEHPIGPGIFQLDSQRGTCVRITEPLQILSKEPHSGDHNGEVPGELLPNSWIRYDSHQTNTLQLELRLPFWAYRIAKAWLAQANCIFAELEETTHVEDYVCVYTVEFTLRISDGHNIPEGYLFVCPPDDFRTSAEPHANLYQWPACPAYWSLDSSGADFLSTEDARILGFPAIHIKTVVRGASWDRNIYQGLRQFHRGKGHDPDSREVAKQLGYPLFEVSSDRVLFPAHDKARRSRVPACDRAAAHHLADCLRWESGAGLQYPQFTREAPNLTLPSRVAFC